MNTVVVLRGVSFSLTSNGAHVGAFHSLQNCGSTPG